MSFLKIEYITDQLYVRRGFYVGRKEGPEIKEIDEKVSEEIASIHQERGRDSSGVVCGSPQTLSEIVM